MKSIKQILHNYMYGCATGFLAYMILTLFKPITCRFEHKILWFICIYSLFVCILEFFICSRKVTSRSELWLRRIIFSIVNFIIIPLLLIIIVMPGTKYIQIHSIMFSFTTVGYIIWMAVFYLLYDLYVRYTVKKINKKLMMNNKENNEK